MQSNQQFFNEVLDAITEQIGDESFSIDRALEVRLTPIKDSPESETSNPFDTEVATAA